MSMGKAIAIIGGIAVGAVGAYNYSTTGCPLGTGSCGTDETAAAVSTQTVAASAAAGDACPLGCSMESDAKTLAVAAEGEASCCSMEGAQVAAAAEGSSCCSSMSKAAAVMSVVKTESAEAGSCCSAEKAEEVAAAVTPVAETAEAKAGCCGQCGEDGEGECDPAACPGGDACCKTVASTDD